MDILSEQGWQENAFAGINALRVESAWAEQTALTDIHILLSQIRSLHKIYVLMNKKLEPTLA